MGSPPISAEGKCMCFATSGRWGGATSGQRTRGPPRATTVLSRHTDPDQTHRLLSRASRCRSPGLASGARSVFFIALFLDLWAPRPSSQFVRTLSLVQARPVDVLGGEARTEPKYASGLGLDRTHGSTTSQALPTSDGTRDCAERCTPQDLDQCLTRPQDRQPDDTDSPS